MDKKPYELIEHTADVGIRVKGKDIKEVFVNAALALFAIIAERKPSSNAKNKTITVSQKADSTDELFVNWLNELLSLSAVHGVIFERFRIDRLHNGELEAVVYGSEARNYRFNVEVKAATYHGLRIEKTTQGWKAEVIFDV